MVARNLSMGRMGCRMHGNLLVVSILLAIAMAVLLSAVPFAAAIPESDLYYFRASVRSIFQFDEGYNGSAGRVAYLKAFQNASNYYYIVLRANAGDALPYDRFDLSFGCTDDITDTFVRTTDYPSWVQSGQISFKRAFGNVSYYTYDGMSRPVSEARCEIKSASGLVPNGNVGYAMFNVELVPLLSSFVNTLQAICESDARAEVTEGIINATGNIVSFNVNILFTLWIILQIVLVVFVVIVLPAIIILMVLWAVQKVTGKKPFGGEDRGY